MAALVLYGVMPGITFAVNVPLNDELAVAGKPGYIAGPAAVRERFEATWVRWNLVRAVVSTAVFGCPAWALALYGQGAAAS